MKKDKPKQTEHVAVDITSIQGKAIDKIMKQLNGLTENDIEIISDIIKGYQSVTCEKQQLGMEKKRMKEKTKNQTEIEEFNEHIGNPVKLSRFVVSVLDNVYEVIDKMMKVAQLHESYLMDEYFRKYDVSKNEDRTAIAYEFKKCEVNAEIIGDYLFDSIDILKELVTLANEVNELDKEQSVCG